MGAVHYFEDFSVGDVFESQGRTITESDLVMFSAWSWDANQVHTDSEFMASSRFEQRIAHGMLGLSVAMGLASRTQVFDSCSIALLGIDDWKFVRPLLIGDTVKCRIEVLSTRLSNSGHSGVLERRFELINQRNEIVQAGEIGLLASTRPQKF